MDKFKVIEQRLNSIESLLIGVKTVLTFDEAVTYTGLSKSYMYKLTSAGMIPHSKPNGKQVYFDRAELDTWLMRNKVKTAEEIEIAAATYLLTNKNRRK